MKISILLSLCAMAFVISGQMNFIGGKNEDFIQNNPSLITKYMEKLTGSVAEAC